MEQILRSRVMLMCQPVRLIQRQKLAQSAEKQTVLSHLNCSGVYGAMQSGFGSNVSFHWAHTGPENSTKVLKQIRLN